MNIEISKLRMTDTEARTDIGMSKDRNTGGYKSVANKYWPSLLKGLELIVCIICIGLFDDPATQTSSRTFARQRTIALAYGTFVTFLIVSGVYLIGKLSRDPYEADRRRQLKYRKVYTLTMTSLRMLCFYFSFSWKSSALFSFIGTVLFIACAGTILRDWSDAKLKNYWPPNMQRMDLLCATGSTAIAGAVILLVDLIATVRQGMRGNLD